ncbi:purine-binding chemotaxis protein CheW [bacterium]|nr:purine-binding chemotaxis protein CheW [bacterium]
MQKIEQQKSLEELLLKLEKIGTTVFDRTAVDSEKTHEILKARAQKIRDLERAEDPGELLEILEFTLVNERFAFPLKWVGEVCRVAEITKIPGTPAFVKGVVNLRRTIYSVIDLAILLGLSPDVGTSVGSRANGGGSGEGDLILTLIADDMEFAVTIDSLDGVSSLPLKQLQSRLPTMTGMVADYFKGITSDRLVVLDAEKLLHDEKIVVEQ